MKRRKSLEIIEMPESQDISELETMIKELKGESFNVYRRVLPLHLNKSKIVALNIPTFKDAMLLVKGMKLKTSEKETDEGKETIFYDILPSNVKLENFFWNDGDITTVGNKKKKVAEAYFDLGGDNE